LEFGLIIAFTGTREGMSNRQTEAFTELIGAFANVIAEGYQTIFVHGGCDGADIKTRDITLSMNHSICVECFPGDESQHKKNSLCISQVVHPIMPYLWRNKKMVNMGGLLVAAPLSMNEENRSGTWSTIRYARKINKPCIILDR
jgi:hypothetical protein